jgi:uncharacterized membrane protein YbjE (DUF340 family)
MKSSLAILGCLVTGILVSAAHLLPAFLLRSEVAAGVLFVLLFLVGVGIGGNREMRELLRRLDPRMALVPLVAVIGTMLGVGIISIAVPGVRLREALAVGAGFGYYSLSSILITQIRGETLGVLALLANVLRELATLVASPLLARYFGRLAPIVSGGATATDTTLPIIVQCAGAEYAVLAVFSGMVLSLLVPFLITFLL